MLVRAIVAAGVTALAASGPALAGEAVRILEPDRVTVPLAGGFMPRLGGLRVGDAEPGSVYALGGEGERTFTVLSGRLPDGVALLQDGRLAGPVLGPGTFAATVRIGDGAGQSADVPVTMEVLPGVRLP